MLPNRGVSLVSEAFHAAFDIGRWSRDSLHQPRSLVSDRSCRRCLSQRRSTQFRQRREAGLKAEDGWLSVVGLHWIHQGEQKLGSDPGCDILLPARAPAVVGSLTLKADKAEFRPAERVKIMRGGAPFGGGEIRSDADGKPDVLET